MYACMHTKFSTHVHHGLQCSIMYVAYIIGTHNILYGGVFFEYFVNTLLY